MPTPPRKARAAATRSLPSIEARVASMQVRALLEGLTHVGVSELAFCTRTGLDRARVSNPQAWFTLAEFDALMTAALAFTGDEAFGLHWGEHAPMSQFDQLPILAATAPTLRAVIDCLMLFQPVLASRDEFRFEERRDRCTIVCEPLARSKPGQRVRAEAALVALLRLLRYFGEGGALHSVSVRHARPPYAAEYQRLFGTVVLFDQPTTSLEFAREACEQSHVGRDLDLHQQLRHRAEFLRRQALGELRYAEQVAELVRHALPRQLRQDEAAHRLNVGERSLRRHLLQEGVSYRELVERVRREAADSLRSEQTTSTKEVAGALGYADVRGFYRAARSWNTADRRARERASSAR